MPVLCRKGCRRERCINYIYNRLVTLIESKFIRRVHLHRQKRTHTAVRDFLYMGDSARQFQDAYIVSSRPLRLFVKGVMQQRAWCMLNGRVCTTKRTYIHVWRIDRTRIYVTYTAFETGVPVRALKVVTHGFTPPELHKSMAIYYVYGMSEESTEKDRTACQRRPTLQINENDAYVEYQQW